ncbi:MAG: hypothetical protein ACFB2X_21180 [Rivularia sp. (in: cyanobacteria)]
MSQHRYTPARLRYLGARLSILARPSFLIGMVFLSAVGLVIKEYWTNPNFLKLSDNQEVSPPVPSSNYQELLSEEDKAIAADIGNLSVLNYEQKQAKTSTDTSLDNIRKQKEKQLKNILDLAKKNQQSNQFTSDRKLERANTSSISPENPFLKQAENVLKLNINTNEKGSMVNNLSPFPSSVQTPHASFNSGLTNTNLGNKTSNTIPENPLKAALSELKNQSQKDTVSPEINPFGKLSPTEKDLSVNQKLPLNQINPLVDTQILNEPSLQNQPYTNNNNQQNLNNRLQNPYSNFNSNQIPTTNYNQQNLNNRVQNPYSNFNSNQIPTTNYNQQNLNNRVQNPYSNFNNTRITGNRYSPQIQTRINNIYNRINNRNNPNVVNSNTFNSPINSINTGIVQPNVQQLNSPYSTQNPTQFPSNGYRY